MHRVAVASLLLLSSLLIPLVNSQASFLRGMLTYHHNTKARLWAIVASISALAVSLVLGVALRADGILMVGVAMTVQIFAELAVLRVFWARTLPPQGTETATDVVP